MEKKTDDVFETVKCNVCGKVPSKRVGIRYLCKSCFSKVKKDVGRAFSRLLRVRP